MMLTMLPSPEALWKSLRRSLPSPLRPPTEEVDTEQVVRETQKHNYVLDRHQIGLGGFSNVYAAQLKKRTPLRNRLSISALRKKLGHGGEDDETNPLSGLNVYTYAIKICELNADNLGEAPKDRYGMPLPMMAAAKLEMLVEEVQILKSLQPSQHIVKLHDSFVLTTTEQFWMVMERLTVDMERICKTDLFKVIPNARESVLKQALDGLAFLKASRIVHGDIKPSNFLISSTGLVKICDFGIAKRLDEDEKLIVENTSGSPPYMAPELWIEGCEYDYGVDLFAFGCVAYACMYKGQSPLAGGVDPYSHRFRNSLWQKWREGNEEYFAGVLGLKYLSEAERKIIYKQNDKLLEVEYKYMSANEKDRRLQTRIKSEVTCNAFFGQHFALIQAIRRCVIPIPTNGPGGEVTRDDVLYRAAIDELQAMDYFTVARNELKSRNNIMKLCQGFMEKAVINDQDRGVQKPSL